MPAVLHFRRLANNTRQSYPGLWLKVGRLLAQSRRRELVRLVAPFQRALARRTKETADKRNVTSAGAPLSQDFD
jgi:hypothetical protein